MSAEEDNAAAAAEGPAAPDTAAAAAAAAAETPVAEGAALATESSKEESDASAPAPAVAEEGGAPPAPADGEGGGEAAAAAASADDAAGVTPAAAAAATPAAAAGDDLPGSTPLPPDTQAAPADPPVPKSTINLETEEGRALQARIRGVFDVFDHDGNDTCDVREVGTIIRSLGVYPTEAQLFDLITEIEEEEPTGYIVYHKFEAMAARVLQGNTYPGPSKAKLLQAFKVLDAENVGHFEPEDFQKLLASEGEPFSPEEIEEMLGAAVDIDKRVVNYEEYATLLASERS